MERPIQYIDYDKLSDDVLFLGSNTTLKLNVSLSNKVEPDKRYHYHREYSYYNKYSESGKLLSMKRSFDYFLTIEKGGDARDCIIIRPQDMIILRQKLNQATTWFNDSTNVFFVKNKHLMNKKTEPIIIPGLAMQKYLQLDPIVLKYENNNDEIPGVRLTLGNESSFVDINVDKFYALVYTIDSFNMYESASVLVNYLGRPSYGFNLVELDMMNTYKKPNKESRLEGAKDNRTIPKQNKSFFSKLDGLED